MNDLKIRVVKPHLKSCKAAHAAAGCGSSLFAKDIVFRRSDGSRGNGGGTQWLQLKCNVSYECQAEILVRCDEIEAAADGLAAVATGKM